MNSTNAPFRVTGIIAILAGGMLAATTAHQPTQPLVWTAAYLVLVAGVVQHILGNGQAALLAGGGATTSATAGLWITLNLGQAGVIAGTLLNSWPVLLAGTILYDIALVWFAVTTRHGQPTHWRAGYMLLLVIMFASSMSGLYLSVHGA